ncbi:glycoside hydrolase family GH30 [Microthyrium microscopicum]|uniref:Glycoside hydrolase family GH30 n=1 Tax=Microthyrium microscopicum TaxID=703497 RepID=A0A6A6U4B1_9PEZI|nr:glycoside hydrolase family GH30 [Microthyrium microscopicum]
MAILHSCLIWSSILALTMAQTPITINLDKKFQTVDGFGFSQAFGRAKEFQTASSAMQKQALDYLFDTTKGAGFSIIRNRIGSGGSGDSILPTNLGGPTAKAKYSFDKDDRGQVWFTKQAVSYGVKTIYADSWSAPGFMKTSGSETKAGYICGTKGRNCASGDWRQAFANFLVQYVQEYAELGFNITHLGFLNEPDFSPSYSQMQISTNAQEAISFIPILYDTVKAAGLDTKLTCCDAMGWGVQRTYTSNLVSSGAVKHLGVITSHSYTGDATSPIGGTSLPMWNTEAGPKTSFVTTWHKSGGENEGMHWANKIAMAMVNAQLSAYLFWEGFEVKQTQSGSHLVDTFDGKTATPSGIFWAFAMWSRHIRPGAVRVGISGALPGTITGAFQNKDGSVVVVFTNNGASTQSAKVAISGFSASSAAAWVTSSSATFATTPATLSGGAVTVSIPARSVVTVKFGKQEPDKKPISKTEMAQ